MNWQIKTSGLLFAALTFLFISCNNDEEGLLLTDQVPADAFFTDTISVTSDIVLVNGDITTSTHQLVLAGIYQDAYTGIVSAEAFSELVRKGTETISNAVVDSAKLFLEYTYSTGDTTALQKLTIYPLTTALDPNATYYSTSPAPSYDISNPAGALSFQARPNTDDNVEIPLDNDYANDLLQAAAVGTFNTAIKGIAIIPDISMPGAVLGFNLRENSSHIKVYYHTDTEDSLALTAELSNNDARFYRIVTDRTGTELSSLVSNYDSVSTSIAGNKGVLQAGTGLKTRLRFPHLDELQKQFGNVIINKAEIILPDVETNNENINNVGTIVLYEADASGKIREVNGARKLIQSGYNQQLTGSPLLVSFDSKNKEYKIPFTPYLQELIDGGRASDGIYISPLSDVPEYVDINEITVNRSVLADQNFTGEQLKLKVYFSVIK